MTVDANDFFREATLRICGSLEIEKALHSCLMYIRNFVPASQMSLHVYHRRQGVVETVAQATPAGGRAIAIRTPLSSKAQRQVQAQRSIRVRVIERLGDDPVTGPVARRLGASDHSAVVMDLVVERTFLGVLSVFDDGAQCFDNAHARLLSQLNEPFGIALTNSLRYRELQRFKDRLADDNRYLQDELRRISGDEIIGADFGLRSVMEQVRQVAHLDSPVLLLGETGTGKEMVASAIHNLSTRRHGPFITVNCGAIPPTLMDSELFGHEKGAFTGALFRKRGRIERAHGGTLFLDEIGELQAEAQVRLLRVLQQKEIDRIGGREPVRVDIRIIAATHRDLERMIHQGRFRKDLYFRLKVFPVALPPLRRRVEDIPALVQHFIQKKARDMKLAHVPALATDALERLMAYPWPGNVRELENAVERALILSRGKALGFDELVPEHGALGEEEERSRPRETPQTLELDEVMGGHILRVLDSCRGRVEGPHGAARLLGIHPSTLRKRMRKLGLPFGRKRGAATPAAAERCPR
jgi:transcriptional regulator with GAF, ATPase, and Fis domain